MEGRRGSLQSIPETRQTSSFKQLSKSRSTVTKQQQLLAVHHESAAVSGEVHQQSHQQQSGIIQSTSKTCKPLKFLVKLKQCFVEQLLTPVDDKSSATGTCFQTVGMLNLRGCEAIGISLASATGSVGVNSNRKSRRVHTTL